MAANLFLHNVTTFWFKQSLSYGLTKNLSLAFFSQIKDGEGSAVLQESKLREQLKSNLNTTLSDVVQSKAQLYMAVSVTDIISKASVVVLSLNKNRLLKCGTVIQ